MRRTKRPSETQSSRRLPTPWGFALLFNLLVGTASWGCAGSTTVPADAASAAEVARTADALATSAGPEVADAVSTLSADAGVLPDLRLATDTVPTDTVRSGSDSPLRDATPSNAEDVAVEASAGKADALGDSESMVGDASPPDGVTGRQDAAILDAVSAAPDADKSGCKADGGPASLVRLSTLELKTLLAGSEDPYLINVKGASIGTIAGTDAVLVNDIAGIETLVGHDLCANIILYCQSGNTSSSVAAQLLAKGYQRIRDLAGGITAWKNAGYPTE